jgi:hypothetical protein
MNENESISTVQVNEVSATGPQKKKMILHCQMILGAGTKLYRG